MQNRRQLLLAIAALATILPATRLFAAHAGPDTPAASVAASSPTGAVGPSSAPVTMIVFSDFACPYSAQLFFSLEKLEARYPTQLRVLLKQSPLPIHPDAGLAHRAALAAGRQGYFRQMAELLYANQTHQDEESILGYARQLHLELARFRRDLASPALAATLAADIEESHAFGIDSTPTIFLNGRSFTGIQSPETLSAAIDKAAAAATDAAASAGPGGDGDGPLDPALVAEIQASPTAAQGSTTAPLTIVEFTDFQCPFCRSALAPMQQFVAARGREVRWEFRAFPLEFHADAQPAAEAALAAGAQGKFWPMHDLLFAHQTALKPADLRRYAEEIQLDMKAFDEAIATHRYAGRIAADRALGIKAGVTGTPTFLIDGHLLVGARQLPELNQIADAHRTPGLSPAVGVVSGGSALAAGAAMPVSGSAHQVYGASGLAGAPLTLTWFTDVRSPLASRQAELLRSLTARYANRIRVFYKAFPVAAHVDGQLGSAALLAALEQDRFWDMFDALAARRDVLDQAKVLTLAAQLRLNVPAFTAALEAATSEVAADAEEASRRGIQGAPVLFLNAQRVDGLQRDAFYTAILDKELQESSMAKVAMP